jgi:hypothetical protein
MLPNRHVVALCASFAAAPAAAAEPWSDDDPAEPPARHEFDDYGLYAGAEYRANLLYVNPIALNGARNRHTSSIEHRLRLDAGLDYDETVTLVLSIDALDGTLWGDNGSFGQKPPADSGVGAEASNPNNVKAAVGYQGGDPFDPDSYGYVLVPSPIVRVRRVYGEVATPVGLLRIGRQPTLEGMGVLAADGDGRPNRFGYGNQGNSSDRVLFVTKPLEALKPVEQRDPARDRGLFFAVAYDRVADGEVRTFGDDVQGVASLLRWSNPDPALRRTLDLRAFHAYRWDRRFDTDLHFFGLRALGSAQRFSAGFEAVYVGGKTREVAEALATIRPGLPVARQRLAQWGARGVARWDDPAWTAYLEIDFASGDANPDPNTPLSQFYWAPDTNVGLLMFERVLAFESARSAGSSSALLQALGAPSNPGERVDTEGAFTNAIAIFPQFDLRPHDAVLLRAGVLVAWTAADLVDPITSLEERVAVNYNGGRPGHFFGTELDGRFQWRYADHFLFDLEAALLFPGDAFQDARGQAGTSVLVQGRTTFVF